MIINGVLSLSEGVLCKGEVLGQIFETTVCGVKTYVYIPTLPEIEDSKWLSEYGLLPPDIGITWKKAEDRTFWGYPLVYPPGDSCVNRLVFTFDCKDEIMEETTKALYAVIEKWDRAFVDYIVLNTKQGVDREKNRTGKICGFQLFTDRIIPGDRRQAIYLTVPDPSEYASQDCIRAAIDFASSGKDLLLEYQMLLSAYDARRNNQNRRAILDACSAMELCLVNSIKEFCQSIGLDSSILLKKYRYLGDRFDLAKAIYAIFPKTDYKKQIVDPRNAVMHNKELYPSDETTDNLISCVEEMLSFLQVSYY